MGFNPFCLCANFCLGISNGLSFFLIICESFVRIYFFQRRVLSIIVKKKSQLISNIELRFLLKFRMLNIIVTIYSSNAFLGLLPHNNSTGFSKASLTATKNPTDSRPSIILWSYDKATYIIG